MQFQFCKHGKLHKAAHTACVQVKNWRYIKSNNKILAFCIYALHVLRVFIRCCTCNSGHNIIYYRNIILKKIFNIGANVHGWIRCHGHKRAHLHIQKSNAPLKINNKTRGGYAPQNALHKTKLFFKNTHHTLHVFLQLVQFGSTAASAESCIKIALTNGIAKCHHAANSACYTAPNGICQQDSQY